MTIILAALKYALLTVKHKWFVLIGGIGIARLTDLLVHDLSKFQPSELLWYGRAFCLKPVTRAGGDKSPVNRTEKDAKVGWVHHQNRNRHHWEYWIDRSTGVPQPMPERFVREMVADWIGASRAYNGRWPSFRNWAEWEWYQGNKGRMKLHDATRILLETLRQDLETRG